MGRLKNLNSLIAAIFFLSLVMLYQNCSNNIFEFVVNGNFVPGKNGSSNVNGNGDGYFGKPLDGQYNGVTDSYNLCSIEYSLVVREGAPSLTLDSCVGLDYGFNIDDPEFYFRPYNPDYLSFYGTVFERFGSESAVLLPGSGEVLCHNIDNENQGLDLIIKYQIDSRVRLATLFTGSWNPESQVWNSFRSAPEVIERDLNDNIYRNSNMTLTITATSGSIPHTYVGTLEILNDGELTSHSMNCLHKTYSGSGATRPVSLLSFDYDRLVQLWSFNGLPGSIVGGSLIDEASNRAADGKLSNADNSGVAFVNGKMGTALRIDGTDDFIEVPPIVPNPANNYEFSIGGWFNSSGNGAIYSESGSGCEISVRLAGQLSFRMDTPIADALELDSPSAMNDGQWHHFLVSAGSILSGEYVGRLFIDGEEKAIVTRSAPLDFSSCNLQAKIVPSEEQGGGTYHFTGMIDELVLWQKAVTALEVQTMYSRQK